MYEELKNDWRPLLLHSRFFSSDRRDKQSKLKEADFILATQVIEAGVDISCNVLLTELAPVNAIVQRAGRCARFSDESGTVHVYEATGVLPYTKGELNAARGAITDTDALNPSTAQNWVEQAHRDEDRSALAGFSNLIEKRRDLVRRRLAGDTEVGAAAYIRRGEDTVRVFILNNPEGKKPQALEAIQVRRGLVRQYRPHAWTYDGDSWLRGGDVNVAYAVALSPSIAGYTKGAGLKLGTAGTIESPAKQVRQRPGWYTLHAEPWVDHTRNVIACSRDRMEKEGLPERLTELVTWAAKLHDVGKLQYAWQEWARETQAARGKKVEVALAHTDYDSKLHKGEPRPPKHAAASALYGASYVNGMPDSDRTALLFAVLGHHGGTLKGVEAAERMHTNAQSALQLVDLSINKPVRHLVFVNDQSDNIWISFDEIWPVAAILSRILRLSDQKATAESSYG